MSGTQPIVALESTVLTHGLPREPRKLSAKFLAAHPEWDESLGVNLALARACEDAVRAAGAVPATVAVIDGEPRAGLSRDELERLAAATDAPKLSLANLGYACANRQSGGTTVAATALIAKANGIRVFSTGGIGGVHRGWGRTLDISADLNAIATHPVLIVSAGPKAILDLSATMEVIETLGIPTIGMGTRCLPRFTVEPSPELKISESVDSAAQVASVANAHWSLRPDGGVLVFQPCPAAFALGSGDAEAAIERALAEAASRGIRGAATTPFLLAQLAQAFDGTRILEANLALLIANARLAASIAMHLAT